MVNPIRIDATLGVGAMRRTGVPGAGAGRISGISSGYFRTVLELECRGKGQSQNLTQSHKDTKKGKCVS